MGDNMPPLPARWYIVSSDGLATLCSKTTERPTPMPASKARAIYIDELQREGADRA